MVKVTIEAVGEVLTKRPEGMSYEEYRKRRKEQQLKERGFTHKGRGVMGRRDGYLITSKQWTNKNDFIEEYESKN